MNSETQILEIVGWKFIGQSFFENRGIQAAPNLLWSICLGSVKNFLMHHRAILGKLLLQKNTIMFLI